MHPRNRYNGKHDFSALAALEPELAKYLKQSAGGRIQLDFTQERAIYLLNRTILKRDYGLRHWDIPADNLTPPVPGRLDYIHTVADLDPDARRVLDIGTGASVIFPILGIKEYDWLFVASDIDAGSLKVAHAIIKFNPALGKRIDLRRQENPNHIFSGVVLPGERFDLTICNPPFHESRKDAERAGGKKWKKLGKRDRGLTFSGKDNELSTPGGEMQFLTNTIQESPQFGEQITWFTTLVSKKGYLKPALQMLKRVGAAERQILPLQQGNKRSRILAWRF